MSNYNFKVPERAINTPRDLEAFKESSALKEIMAFVKTCAESVIGLKASHVTGSVCEVVSKYEEFIGKLKDLVAQTPPLKQPGRFGNKAFRTWHAAMVTETELFLDALLPEGELKGAALELTPYITGAFGNETRIDYGTGHELCFAVFFLCAFKLKLITQADFPVVILRGFTAYLRLMRLLQDTYMLEPAGSHGVWGLDDYHCLLFLWGSAQLCKQGGGDGDGDGDANRDGGDGTVLSPRAIHDQELLEEYGDEYLYFGGIRAIKQMKTGAPFSEIAPMLNDISMLPEWRKLLLGLLRLFQAEVMLKLPVVQHVVFGSIVCAADFAKKEEAEKMGEVGEAAVPPTTVFQPAPSSGK
jgi:hypothetical protein